MYTFTLNTVDTLKCRRYTVLSIKSKSWFNPSLITFIIPHNSRLTSIWTLWGVWPATCFMLNYTHSSYKLQIHRKAEYRTPLTHSCPLFKYLLSERLTSLGIMGTPEISPLYRETSVSRTANVGTMGMNGLSLFHTQTPSSITSANPRPNEH